MLSVMHKHFPMLIVKAVAMLFLLCLAMVISFQFILLQSNHLIANGFVVKACTGIEWEGRIQFGLGWYWPWVAYRLGHEPPFYGAPVANHMVCTLVPWLPTLPNYGTFIFPR